MSKIENYIADLQNFQRQWRSHWVLAYGSAYTRAYERFKQTLDDQKKLDEFKASIAMMALSMGIGGGLGAMFGKTALKSVVLDGAISTVCDRNMVRVFDKMAWIADNPGASFIVGKAWDNAEKLLTDQTKLQLTALIGQSAAGRDVVAHPQIAQNKLEQYLLNVIAAAHDVAADIRDNPALNDAQRDALAADLYGAPLAKPPTRDVVATGGSTPTADEKALELAMYMPMVMAADVLARYTATANSVWADYSRQEKPITISPTSDKYPRPGAAEIENHYTFGIEWWPLKNGHTVRRSAIEYKQLGSRIVARINLLHKQRYGRDFFTGSLDGEELRRAELTIKTMNHVYTQHL